MSGAHDPHDDDPIIPDEVLSGDVSGARTSGATSSAEAGIDELARRAVDIVLHLVRRAMALAGGVLAFVLVAVVGGFLLGLAALDGGVRTIWIVVGGFLGLLAIGSLLTAVLRLRAVRRSAGELVGEVRSLMSGDRSTRRTVHDTVSSAEGKSDGGIVDLSREFFTIRGAIGDRVGQFRGLTTAMTAVTTFPGLMALAAVIAFGFAGLGVLFAISLAL